MDQLATNPKASFDYDILETFEAGIMLSGNEVKSIKSGHVQLRDAFVKISQNRELFLHNCFIAPYSNANEKSDGSYRIRKLLLRSSEIDSIIARTKGQNLTIVPLKVYNNRRGLVKVEIALAKGKRKYEKRRTEKEKEVKREIGRTLKTYS